MHVLSSLWNNREFVTTRGIDVVNRGIIIWLAGLVYDLHALSSYDVHALSSNCA